MKCLVMLDRKAEINFVFDVQNQLCMLKTECEASPPEISAYGNVHADTLED